MTTFPEAPDFPVAAQAWKRKIEKDLSALAETLARVERNASEQSKSSAAGIKAIAQQLTRTQITIDESAASGRAPDTLTVAPYTYAKADGSIRGGASVQWTFESDDTYDQEGAVTQFEVWMRPLRADPTNPEDDDQPVPALPENDSKRVTATPNLYAEIIDLAVGTQYALKVRPISSSGGAGDFTDEAIFTTPSTGPELGVPSAPILETSAGNVYAAWDGNLGGNPAPVHFRTLAVEVKFNEADPWVRLGTPLTKAGSATFSAAVGAQVFVSFIAFDSLGHAGTRSPISSTFVAGVQMSELDELITDAITDALDAANHAQSTADGKTTISPNAPVVGDGAGKPTGALWWRQTAGKVVGLWEWTGTAWATRAFDETFVPQINIGSGTYGELDGVRIKADSISVRQLLVSNLTNLCDDPSFEVGGAWSLNSAATYDTTAPRTGARHLKVVTTGALVTGMATLPAIQVEEGEVYQFTYWARTASGTSPAAGWRAALRRGATSSVEAGVSAVGPASDLTTTYQPVTVTYTVGAGIKFIRPEIRQEAAATGTVYIDDAMWIKRVDGSLIVDGAIDGKTITGATIRTAASGQRLQLDTTGLRSYNSSNAVTASLAAATGGLQLTGALRMSGAWGGYSLLDSSLLEFYGSTGTYVGSIGYGNGEVALTARSAEPASAPDYDSYVRVSGTQGGSDDYVSILSKGWGLWRNAGNLTLSSGSSSILELNFSGGDIALGSTTTETYTGGYLRLTRTTATTLTSTTHPFQIGPTSGSNLRFDTSRITSVNNGAAAGLTINENGGYVTIGSLTDGYVRLRPVMNSSTQSGAGASGTPLLSIVESTGEVRRAVGALNVGYMRHMSESGDDRAYFSTNADGTLTGAAYAAVGIDTGYRFWVTNNGSGTSGQLFDISSDGVIRAVGTYSNAISGSYRVAYIGANHQFGYVSSSRRFKQDITDANLSVEALRQIPIASFRYIKDVAEQGADAPVQLGTLAEDVAALGLEQFVYRDDEGTIDGIAYDRLSLAALALAQNLADRLDALEAGIES